MSALLDGVTWLPVVAPLDDGSDLPFATHHGVLNIGGLTLRCYRLSTGQDILDAEDFEKFFTFITEGDPA